MSHILLLCLILADTSVVLSMANGRSEYTNESYFSNQPAPSPSHGDEVGKATAPVIRKLGGHPHHPETPGSKESMQTQSTKERSSSDRTVAIEPKNEENGIAEGEKVVVKKQHHSMDKSIAGGGVIIGGLATAFMVAVFCYIRATGRKNPETTSQLT